MRLVYKAVDTQVSEDTRPPRWPNRPLAFALSAAPYGCDREWADVTGRADRQDLQRRAAASQARR